MARARIPCPHCGQLMDDPNEMQPVELRAVRGVIGARLGYGGPMPQGKLAHLLRISPRTLWSYEHGKTPIPAHVASEARRIRDDRTISWETLPKRWKRQLDNTKARKEAYRRRKEARDREKDVPPPPF